MKRLLLLMIFAPLFVHGQIITTIAGNGMSGLDSGDGGQATAATINPDCIAIDKDGAIYFSNGRIVRKIDSAGIITTVAGTGVFGYNGDGIQATMANLKHISSIALDRNKNLFIADSYDYRVRKVNALTGIISTIAGNGLSGLGYPWPSNGGQATAASLSLLGGICVDKWDNLCITGFDHVLKVDTAGIISVVAGDSTHPWSFPFTSPAPATSTGILDPTNICTDTFGNLYFDFYYIRHRSVTKLRGVLKLDI